MKSTQTDNNQRIRQLELLSNVSIISTHSSLNRITNKQGFVVMSPQISKSSATKFYFPLDIPNKDNDITKIENVDNLHLKEKQIKSPSNVFFQHKKQPLRLIKHHKQFTLSDLLPSTSPHIKDPTMNSAKAVVPLLTPKMSPINKNTSLFTFDHPEYMLKNNHMKMSQELLVDKVSTAQTPSEKHFIIKNTTNLQRNKSWVYNTSIGNQQQLEDAKQISITKGSQTSKHLLNKMLNNQTTNETFTQSYSFFNQNMLVNSKRTSIQEEGIDKQVQQNQKSQQKLLTTDQNCQKNNIIEIKNNFNTSDIINYQHNESMLSNRTEKISFSKINTYANSYLESQDLNKLSSFSRNQCFQTAFQETIQLFSDPLYKDQKFKVTLPSSLKNILKKTEQNHNKTQTIQSPFSKLPSNSHKRIPINRPQSFKKTNYSNHSSEKQIDNKLVSDYFNQVFQNHSKQGEKEKNIPKQSQKKQNYSYSNEQNHIDLQSQSFHQAGLLGKQLSFCGSPSNKEVQEIIKSLNSKKNGSDTIQQQRRNDYLNKTNNRGSSSQYDGITYSIEKKQNLPFGCEIDKKKLSKIKKQNSWQSKFSNNNSMAQNKNSDQDHVCPPQNLLSNPQTPKQVPVPTLSQKDMIIKKEIDINQPENYYSKHEMNQNNKIFRQIVSQNQRKKLVPAQVRIALKKALYYLRSLNITTQDLLTTQVFSSKPFEKEYSYELIQAAKFGDVMKVRECLNENRYLVYDFDYIYQTGLHWATKRNHIQIAELLLQNGADVNCKDIMGRTPLYFAIQQGYTDICLLLLENKASPWSTEEINYVQIAKDNIKILAYLTKFKKVNIINSMVPLSKQQQLWEKQIQLLHY